jgi:hypothetical protein
MSLIMKEIMPMRKNQAGWKIFSAASLSTGAVDKIVRKRFASRQRP